MQHVETAKKLLQWNAKNLVASADLKKSEVGHYLADTFLVLANGKRYEANRDSYFDFLNGFRATIQTIRYELNDFVIDQMSVVIPMKAHIVRTNGSIENFEAILILKFNRDGKIVLWHELYIRM